MNVYEAKEKDILKAIDACSKPGSEDMEILAAISLNNDEGYPFRLRRALIDMHSQGLTELTNNHYRLTEAGRRRMEEL